MPDVLRVKSRLRDYRVHFVSDISRAIGNQKNSEAFLIIDQDLPQVARIIKLFSPQRIIRIKANESHKTLAQCTAIIQQLLNQNVRRNNLIFAVGGGVVEDVVAFISTILFRGVDWVFCPTTLLAQADSCIGSKSSINFGSIKNLLGSFYPPSIIYIDGHFLKTLPEDQIKSGIGEILHFYLVAGKVKLANQMMSDYSVFLKNPSKLKPYIVASLETKKKVIERDELDKGERLLFNYGHTFGHGIETITHYKISHGQAITLGMDLANYLSLQLGYINHKVFNQLHEILWPNIPKFKMNPAQIDDYLKALSKDKKNIGKTLGCILTRGPGKMFKTQLPLDQHLKKHILSYFN